MRRNVKLWLLATVVAVAVVTALVCGASFWYLNQHARKADHHHQQQQQLQQLSGAASDSIAAVVNHQIEMTTLRYNVQQQPIERSFGTASASSKPTSRVLEQRAKIKEVESDWMICACLCIVFPKNAPILTASLSP